MPSILRATRAQKIGTYLPGLTTAMNSFSSNINVNIRFVGAEARNMLCYDEEGSSPSQGIIVVFYTTESKWNFLGGGAYPLPAGAIAVDSEWADLTYPGFEGNEQIKSGIQQDAQNIASPPIPNADRHYCRWVAVIIDRQQNNVP